MTGLSINKKIYEILSNDAELSGMCTNIYPLIAEESVQFPFVLFTRNDVSPIDSKSYVAGDQIEFSIAIVNDKYMLTVDIAERIRKLFEKRRDGYFNEINFVGCSEEYTNNAYVQQLNFVATVLKR